MIEKCVVKYIIRRDKGNLSSIRDSLLSLNLVSKEITKKGKEEFYKYLSFLPSQTIFSVPVNNSDKEENVYVSLPFFSSHYSFPINIGEEVWVYPYKFENMPYNIINSYWMCRPHGMSFSENSDISRGDGFKSLENIFKNKKISFKTENTDNNLLNSSLKVNKLSPDKNNYILDSTPSLPFEDNSLILQSSNNSIIHMGNFKNKKQKEADIRMISGRHSSLNYIFKEKIMVSDPDDNGKIFEVNLYYKNISMNKKKPGFYFYEIEEVQGKTSIKDLNYMIFNNDSLKTQIKEADRNIKNYNFEGLYDDFSKIEVLSSDTRAKDFYDKNYQYKKGYNLFGITSELTQSLKLKEKLNSEENENIFYFKDKDQPYGVDNIPSINLVSSNIRILSKPQYSEYENKESHLDLNESGEILLLKNSFEKEKTAKINITEEGNIILDGSKILIGSYNREENLQHGSGSLVILGHSKEIESLVLGYQLKNFLVEIMEINKEAFERINKTQKAFLEFTDSTLSTLGEINQNVLTLSSETLFSVGIGATTNANSSAVLTNINANLNKLKNDVDKSINDVNDISKDSNVQNRLDHLINKIDVILSKFVKTS